MKYTLKMTLVKKLFFAPLFLISFIVLFYYASPLLQSTGLIFSLDLQTFIKLVVLSALILTSAIFFIMFTSLSLDWKIILPVIILSALTPILFIPLPLNLIIDPLMAASLLLVYMGLESKMKSYLTFQAPALLNPSVKHLVGLLILLLSITYYLSVNKEVSEKGFSIPDSLIDSALKFVPQPTLSIQGFKYDGSTSPSILKSSGLKGSPQVNLIAQLPQITPEQIELLKQNPELLKQYGIDPKELDNLSSLPIQPGAITQFNQQLGSALNPTTELVKPMIKTQLQNMLKPYQSFIPAVLALLFFLTLQSFTAILGIFLSPIIWLIFWVLGKINFIHFETEMREVKKLVV